MCLPTGSQEFKNSFLMLRIYSRAQFESCVLVFVHEQKLIKMDMKNPRRRRKKMIGKLTFQSGVFACRCRIQSQISCAIEDECPCHFFAFFN